MALAQAVYVLNEISINEHQEFLANKIKSLQGLHGLILKKLEFFDNALVSENPEAVRCMDYSDEWARFKTFLGGDKHD